MDPADFISLAVRFSNSQREADLRTAVSRAYYGAFHMARNLLEDCGVKLSGNELYKVEVHQKLRYCLGESGNEEAMLLGKKLGSLRDRRNEADYDLDSTTFVEQNSFRFWRCRVMRTKGASLSAETIVVIMAILQAA